MYLLHFWRRTSPILPISSCIVTNCYACVSQNLSEYHARKLFPFQVLGFSYVAPCRNRQIEALRTRLVTLHAYTYHKIRFCLGISIYVARWIIRAWQD
ncbi:hypothetical protein BT96DRAFT_52205 [Gymnopus androsaceus JB14]|uniref:Uncharacterized protein n=1 Tax=Gymnopus androsaceus JB14 TaxID=1447944 RepID=A0A6A4IDP8_9AGAR|nr:hypothetical protein BT96DRAFT_52205 [Gymnopus androsaceus JB14]